jgi:hypothetical protein
LDVFSPAFISISTSAGLAPLIIIHHTAKIYIYKLKTTSDIFLLLVYIKKLNKSEPYSCRRIPFHAGVYTDAAIDGLQDGIVNIIHHTAKI